MYGFNDLVRDLNRHRQQRAAHFQKSFGDLRAMAGRAIRRTPKTPEGIIAKALEDPRIQARLKLAKAHECLNADIAAGVPAATIAENERRLHRVTVGLRRSGLI